MRARPAGSAEQRNCGSRGVRLCRHVIDGPEPEGVAIGGAGYEDDRADKAHQRAKRSGHYRPDDDRDAGAGAHGISYRHARSNRNAEAGRN